MPPATEPLPEAVDTISAADDTDDSKKSDWARVMRIVALCALLALITLGTGATFGNWLTSNLRHQPVTVPVADSGSFAIAGSAPEPFRPGVEQSLDLTITNANEFAIDVSQIDVHIAGGTTFAKNGAPNPVCSGTANLDVVQQFTGSLKIPAKTTETLTAAGATASQLPQVRMPDLSTDQDGCRNTVFHFSYSGSAS